MKTLEEIISRQDYVRVNEALKARGKELASKFADKFNELYGAWDFRESDFPPKTIEVNGHQYCTKLNIYRDNFERYTDGYRFVRVKQDPSDDGTVSYSLNRFDYGFEASRKDFVDFLNDAKDILAKLSEGEDELVKECEEAIENAKGIV